MGYVWVYMQKMELRYWWEYGDFTVANLRFQLSCKT